MECGGWGQLTIRSASALRFSKGCSSLNLDRILKDVMWSIELGCWVCSCRCVGWITLVLFMDGVVGCRRSEGEDMAGCFTAPSDAEWIQSRSVIRQPKDGEVGSCHWMTEGDQNRSRNS